MALVYQGPPDESNNRQWGTYDPSQGRLGVRPGYSYQGEYGNESVGDTFGRFYTGQYWDEYGGGEREMFQGIENPLYTTWDEYQRDPYGLGANKYHPYANNDKVLPFLQKLTQQAGWEGAPSPEQMLYERWMELNGPNPLPYGIGGKYQSNFTIPYANEGFGREYIGVATRAQAQESAAAYDLAKWYMSQPGFTQKYGRAYSPEEIGLNWGDTWNSAQHMWDGYINSEIRNNKGGMLGGLMTLLPFILPPLMGIAMPALAASMGGVAGGIDAASAAGIMGGVEGAALGGLSPLVTSVPSSLASVVGNLGQVNPINNPATKKLIGAALNEAFAPDQPQRQAGFSGARPVTRQATSSSAAAQPMQATSMARTAAAPSMQGGTTVQPTPSTASRPVFRNDAVGDRRLTPGFQRQVYRG